MQFSQEVVYDSSGTDYLYTRFFIEVEAVLNEEVFPLTQFIPPELEALGHTQPVQAMAGPHYPTTIDGLRPFLLATRKQLLYSDDNDVPLLQIPRLSAGNGPPEKPTDFVQRNNEALTDEKLGPFPRSCSITNISGSTTYVIRFAVEAFAVECPQNPDGKSTTPILSNRWRESMNIDRQMFQRRTHAGKLVLSGTTTNFLTEDPGIKRPISADDFREWVFPVTPAGFTRESIDINLSEDGLELSYTITDKAQYRVTDPAGVATDIEASYTEHTGNGWMVEADITIRIKGNPKSNARDLIALACLIALSRMGVKKNADKDFDVNGNVTLTGIPFAASITENLMYPAVEMRMTIKKTVRDQSVGVSIGLGAVGNASGFNPDAFSVCKFGISQSNLGLETLPSTADGNFYSGMGPAAYGLPPIRGLFNGNAPPGLVMIAQVLSNPCRTSNCYRLNQYRRSANPLVDGNAIPADPLSENTCDNRAPIDTGAYISDDSGPYGSPIGDGGNSGIDATITLVTAAIIDLPEEATTKYSNATLQFMFTNYQVDVVYDSEAGAIQLPVQNDVPTNAVFISTNAEVSRKTVRWTAERAGAWPILPSITTSNTNEVYLDKRVVPAAPELMNDAETYLYRVSGEYHYGLKSATVETESLDTAAMPYLKASFTESVMPASVFQSGIITPKV